APRSGRPNAATRRCACDGGRAARRLRRRTAERAGSSEFKNGEQEALIVSPRHVPGDSTERQGVRQAAGVEAGLRHNATTHPADVIKYLNVSVVGWANYYQHACSSRIYQYVD